MNKIIPLIAVLALLGAGVYLYINRAEPNNTDTGNTTQNPTKQTYSNDTYGISFQYPVAYQLEEQNVSLSGQENIAVVLIDKANLPLPENGEGPPAITVNFFRYELDEQTPENWIRNATSSNFNLSDGTLRTSTVGGAQALGYKWDGLYRGDSVVFAHNNYMVMMSVTYLSPEDKIRTDFTEILSSVTLR